MVTKYFSDSLFNLLNAIIKLKKTYKGWEEIIYICFVNITVVFLYTNHSSDSGGSGHQTPSQASHKYI